MKKFLLLATSAAMLTVAASARAHGFSVRLAIPPVAVHIGPPVYVASPPVYVAPPVYLHPPPVYVAPRVVLPAPVCGPPVVIMKSRHHHHRHCRPYYCY